MPLAREAKPRVLTVTQLNSLVKDMLEGDFSTVHVEGELSGPRTYPSGHTYFTLKDADSQISAVLFKGNAAKLKFEMEHGLDVVARGRLSIYLPRGQYQLIVSDMRPKAMGALQLAFEQLKKKLEAEGLFDELRKRPIPPYPDRVGIVTSRQGAAVRDMLSTLRRCPAGLRIRLFPVAVQGAEAAPQIVRAIEDCGSRFPDTDVLLVGRGGGSLEDLWAFNEESVARAIAASEIPVISCVGHETDFTIADFVADERQKTPTAGAERVVAEWESAPAELENLEARLVASMGRMLGPLEEKLKLLSRSSFLKHPERIFEVKAQRIDELTARLIPGLRELIKRTEERLRSSGPARLASAAKNLLSLADKDLRALAEKLDALSPLKVLSRGYAIAFKEPGRDVLRRASDVGPADEVTVRLHDGEFKAEVK